MDGDFANMARLEANCYFRFFCCVALIAFVEIVSDALHHLGSDNNDGCVTKNVLVDKCSKFSTNSLRLIKETKFVYRSVKTELCVWSKKLSNLHSYMYLHL